MEVNGKLIKILPAQSGEGKNGMWKKQSFIIETLDEYPKQICFTTWNNRVELDKMVIGEKIKIQFDIESREYNERWYTDLKAWKSETIEAPTMSTEFIPSEQDIAQDSFNEFTDDGDLPF